MAGICNWLVAIPMDVVKSRLQAAPEGTYTGAVDVLKKLLKSEGPVALYKGCVPILPRSFPANAACFMGYEVAMYGLNAVAPSL
jgi:solute carrier family 25 carnitine/acylcarnitine transporter 20/29